MFGDFPRSEWKIFNMDKLKIVKKNKRLYTFSILLKMPIAVNTILLQRNRLIGYRIAEEELTGENRAEYGAKIIKSLQMIS